MRNGWKDIKQNDLLSKPLDKVTSNVVNQLQSLFGNANDFQSTSIRVDSVNGFVCSLSTMADSESVTKKLLEPLAARDSAHFSSMTKERMEIIRQEQFGVLPFVYAKNIREAAERMLDGDALIILEGMDQALCIEIGGFPTRSIMQPNAQTVNRGSNDAFSEPMDTNISLIRRRLRNPLLRIVTFQAGDETGTAIALLYLANAAEESLVAEFRSRLSGIRTKAVYDSGNIEELIRDKGSWFFPTLLSVERPDTAASVLVEGKCVVIVNGSPFVLIGPAVYGNFFQAAGDYYSLPIFAGIIRFMRHFAFLVSLFLPALYLSIINYHSEMVPTALLYSISGQEQGSPFPTIFSLVAMMLVFEVLREAGTRVPNAIGQAVPLAGAIVLGQAAVEAGVVSNILLIVVAATELCGLVIPYYDFSNTVRWLRFGLLVLSSIFGVYGIFLGVALLVAHLASLQSYGVPYLEPFAPLRFSEQRDMLVRTSLTNEESS